MTELNIKNTIVSHYEECFLEHGDTHLGVDWPDQENANRRYKVMLSPALIEPSPIIHDYGCGLAHLYQYIRNREISHKVVYIGSDASPIFVNQCHKKFPEVPFEELTFDDGIFKLLKPDRNFAFIIANGVFTEKRELSKGVMWDLTQRTLAYLFKRTEVCLSVNFMSAHVDWQRDDLFHLPVDSLLDFCTEYLSRHVNIISNYGLYEYTAHIYKTPMV